VTKLFAKPGDVIHAGQPLFVVEATDMVQAQSDFMAALATVNKARSQAMLTQTVEKRLHDLYDSKAMSLREWQQAQADLTAAQNDLRSAETALEATRNRLRILGKSEAEITAFQQTGRINADTAINAPIGGTIVQRKVGPGQYVAAGSSDPVFVVRDLTTVWLVAYVRESEASRVQVGQALEFTTLSDPQNSYRGNINYRRFLDGRDLSPPSGPRHDRQPRRHAQARDVRRTSRSSSAKATRARRYRARPSSTRATLRASGWRCRASQSSCGPSRSARPAAG